MIRIDTQIAKGEALMPTRIVIAIPHHWLRDTVQQMLAGEMAQITCAATLDALRKPHRRKQILCLWMF